MTLKAYEERARELEEEDGRANAEKHEMQEQGYECSSEGVQETEHQPSGSLKNLKGRNEKAQPEVKHNKSDEQRDSAEGDYQQGHRENGGTAEPSAAIDADTVRTQKSGSRDSLDDVATSRVHKPSLPIGAPRRIRDGEHLRFVASQPCIICGRAPGRAHHLRFAQPRALGRKVSDEWTVPLCSTHHGALHSIGDEKRWWTEKGIDPVAHAVGLWWDTRHGGVRQSNEMKHPGY